LNITDQPAAGYRLEGHDRQEEIFVQHPDVALEAEVEEDD
jgi:hypothetical protein